MANGSGRTYYDSDDPHGEKPELGVSWQARRAPTMKELLIRHRLLIRWVVALVLLGLSVRLVASDPEPLRRLLRTPPWVLAGIATLVALNQLLMSMRLSLAVEHCGGRGVSQATWFRLTSVGQFLNQFVPQLGNVYRAVVLKRDHGLSYLSYASALFAFVWLDTVMAFVIAFVIVAALEPGLLLLGFPALLVLGLVIAGVSSGPLVLHSLFERFRPTSTSRHHARLVTLLSTARGALRSPGFLARFFLINVVTTAVHAGALFLGFFAVGASIGIGGLVLFQVFIRLSNLIQVTPGNLGVNELAYGLLAHASSASAEQGVGVALLSRAVGMVTVNLLGVACGGGPLLFGRRAELDTSQLEK
jgi:uncharacterized membrane protein YbhN (UPF0104 family)